jgi:hypothetical protein
MNRVDRVGSDSTSDILRKVVWLVVTNSDKLKNGKPP